MYAFKFVLKNISKSILLDILNIDNHITSISPPPLYLPPLLRKISDREGMVEVFYFTKVTCKKVVMNHGKVAILNFTHSNPFFDFGYRPSGLSKLTRNLEDQDKGNLKFS